MNEDIDTFEQKPKQEPETQKEEFVGSDGYSMKHSEQR